jgi:hypothetical protein
MADGFHINEETTPKIRRNTMSQTTKDNIGKKIFRSAAIVMVLITLAVLVTSCARPWRRGGHHHYMNDNGVQS